jgi:WD40 repeat protein
VADLAWILGGGTLAVATSASVSLREAVTGREERVFHARDPILNMAFSPSGKWLMTGNQDCSVHVWNTDNGGEMHMRGYAAKVRQLAWHRGSRWLAAGGGEAISVWDCSGRGPEGRTPAVLEWHSGPDQRAPLSTGGGLAGLGRAGWQRGGLVADAAAESDQRGEDFERRDAGGVVAGWKVAGRDRRKRRGAGAGGGARAYP